MGRLTRNDRQVPDGWQVVRLGDVAEVNRHSWNPTDGTSSILYLDLTAVIAPGTMDPPRRIRASDAPSRARRRVRTGDTLVSTVRPYLRGFARVREAPENLIASTGFAVVSPKPTVDGSFVYQHVMTPAFSNHLENAMTGQAYPAVRPRDVATYSLALPQLIEQRAIAAVLDSIDEAIERTETVIAATEGLRDALLHELLTRGVPGWHTEWKDAPGIGTIPADWEVVRLGEVAEVQTGRAVNRKATRNGNLQVPYLSVANVKDGHLDLGLVKTMLVSESEVKQYRLRDGDLLLTEGGDADKLGRGTVWRDEISPCLHQNHIFAVRPSQGVLHANFLASFVVSAQGKRFFLGAAKQTTNLASINSSQLKRMPTPLPNFSEQVRVVEVLSAIDEAINLARTQYEGLQSLKAATADALLTGRVKVSSQV